MAFDMMEFFSVLFECMTSVGALYTSSAVLSGVLALYILRRIVKIFNSL